VLTVGNIPSGQILGQPARVTLCMPSAQAQTTLSNSKDIFTSA